MLFRRGLRNFIPIAHRTLHTRAPSNQGVLGIAASEEYRMKNPLFWMQTGSVVTTVMDRMRDEAELLSSFDKFKEKTGQDRSVYESYISKFQSINPMEYFNDMLRGHAVFRAQLARVDGIKNVYEMAKDFLIKNNKDYQDESDLAAQARLEKEASALATRFAKSVRKFVEEEEPGDVSLPSASFNQHMFCLSSPPGHEMSQEDCPFYKYVAGETGRLSSMASWLCTHNSQHIGLAELSALKDMPKYRVQVGDVLASPFLALPFTVSQDLGETHKISPTGLIQTACITFGSRDATRFGRMVSAKCNVGKLFVDDDGNRLANDEGHIISASGEILAKANSETGKYEIAEGASDAVKSEVIKRKKRIDQIFKDNMRKESFKIPTKEAMKVLDKIKMHKIKTTDGAYLAHSCGSVCDPAVGEWVQNVSQQKIQESFPIYKKFPIMTKGGYREVPLELDNTLSNKPITLKPTLPVKKQVLVTDMEFDDAQLNEALSKHQIRSFFEDFNRILKAGSTPSLGK